MMNRFWYCLYRPVCNKTPIFHSTSWKIWNGNHILLWQRIGHLKVVLVKGQYLGADFASVPLNKKFAKENSLILFMDKIIISKLLGLVTSWRSCVYSEIPRSVHRISFSCMEIGNDHRYQVSRHRNRSSELIPIIIGHSFTAKNKMNFIIITVSSLFLVLISHFHN